MTQASPLDRQLLEDVLHAMQRRSGTVSAMPDEFDITYLDVIIYQELKLGAGGFAEVFQADWKGTQVAVKILASGVPPSVGVLLAFGRFGFV